MWMSFTNCRYFASLSATTTSGPWMFDWFTVPQDAHPQATSFLELQVVFLRPLVDRPAVAQHSFDIRLRHAGKGRGWRWASECARPLRTTKDLFERNATDCAHNNDRRRRHITPTNPANAQTSTHVIRRNVYKKTKAVDREQAATESLGVMGERPITPERKACAPRPAIHTKSKKEGEVCESALA